MVGAVAQEEVLVAEGLEVAVVVVLGLVWAAA
jgi:hypothetical protein